MATFVYVFSYLSRELQTKTRKLLSTLWMRVSSGKDFFYPHHINTDLSIFWPETTPVLKKAKIVQDSSRIYTRWFFQPTQNF